MLKQLVYLFFYLSAIQQITGQEKLHVEVLYESLCPDSLNFITQQLYPTFREVAPFIQLKLTPFGKSASLQNGADFVCQHGPQECKGNRIQSCVLAAIPDQTAQVEYVNCFMKRFKKQQKNELEFGQQCSDPAGINFNEIQKCYSSSVGTNLQLIAEQATLKFLPKFVPTIVYNGIFNQQLQDQSLINFKGVVCGLLSQSYAQACHSSIIRF